MNYGLN
ncbi:hypothetical protein F383_05893 [Gossypium arboreum]|nr:hypothetical protein F383_05893 [Gossypium arboreum]